jgi:hypothetical protein
MRFNVATNSFLLGPFTVCSGSSFIGAKNLQKNKERGAMSSALLNEIAALPFP